MSDDAIAYPTYGYGLRVNENERGPRDKMKLLFEAVDRLNEGEQKIIQELLEGMIVKYEARRWTGTIGE